MDLDEIKKFKSYCTMMLSICVLMVVMFGAIISQLIGSMLELKLELSEMKMRYELINNRFDLEYGPGYPNPLPGE